jgi:hypothetical protein
VAEAYHRLFHRKDSRETITADPAGLAVVIETPPSEKVIHRHVAVTTVSYSKAASLEGQGLGILWTNPPSATLDSAPP